MWLIWATLFCINNWSKRCFWKKIGPKVAKDLLIFYLRKWKVYKILGLLIIIHPLYSPPPFPQKNNQLHPPLSPAETENDHHRLAHFVLLFFSIIIFINTNWKFNRSFLLVFNLKNNILAKKKIRFHPTYYTYLHRPKLTNPQKNNNLRHCGIPHLNQIPPKRGASLINWRYWLVY